MTKPPQINDDPLAGLTLAAKDIFDVVGYVTGGGNPDWKSTHDAAEMLMAFTQEIATKGARE